VASGGTALPGPATVALRVGGEAARLPGFAPPLVVERTFAWLGLSRRLSKDYERPPETSEATIYGAMRRIMLRRLAGAA
jgi:hypothetical protein